LSCWSASGITLRLSFINRRNFAFAAFSYFSPLRDETPAEPRSTRSLLWHRSRITPLRDRFFHSLSLYLSFCLSFCLCLYFYIYIYISLSLSLGLSSLGATLAKQVPLSLEWTISTKIFFRRNERRMLIRWSILDTIFIRVWNQYNILKRFFEKMFDYIRLYNLTFLHFRKINMKLCERMHVIVYLY